MTIKFKQTPPPDGPSVAGVSGEILKLAFSNLEPAGVREERYLKHLDMTDEVAAATKDGPVATYQAAVAERDRVAASRDTAQVELDKFTAEREAAVTAAEPGFGAKLLKLDGKIASSKRELEAFGARLQSLTAEVRSARAAAEHQIQQTLSTQRVKRLNEVNAERSKLIDKIIATVGDELIRIMALTSADAALAAYDAVAVAKVVANKILGPVPQPPAKPPVEPITGPRMVPGLGRIGYVAGPGVEAQAAAKSLNQALTNAYKDRLEPTESK